MSSSTLKVVDKDEPTAAELEAFFAKYLFPDALEVFLEEKTRLFRRSAQSTHENPSWTCVACRKTFSKKGTAKRHCESAHDAPAAVAGGPAFHHPSSASELVVVMLPVEEEKGDHNFNADSCVWGVGEDHPGFLDMEHDLDLMMENPPPPPQHAAASLYTSNHH